MSHRLSAFSSRLSAPSAVVGGLWHGHRRRVISITPHALVPCRRSCSFKRSSACRRLVRSTGSCASTLTPRRARTSATCGSTASAGSSTSTARPVPPAVRCRRARRRVDRARARREPAGRGALLRADPRPLRTADGAGLSAAGDLQRERPVRCCSGRDLDLHSRLCRCTTGGGPASTTRRRQHPS